MNRSYVDLGMTFFLFYEFNTSASGRMSNLKKPNSGQVGLLIFLDSHFDKSLVICIDSGMKKQSIKVGKKKKKFHPN